MMSMVLAALDEQTMKPGMQSFRETLRRIRKRKRWGSQRSFTPDNITLGALRMRVKRYNTGLDRLVTPYTTIGPHRMTSQ
jgi:hypothetical protein